MTDGGEVARELTDEQRAVARGRFIESHRFLFEADSAVDTQFDRDDVEVRDPDDGSRPVVGVFGSNHEWVSRVRTDDLGGDH